jgi:hypothetical protein
MSRSLATVRARTTRAIGAAELPSCWVQSTYAAAANAAERKTVSARASKTRLDRKAMKLAAVAS